MPLPAALAARLSKRGFVAKHTQELEEEVIAENYETQDDNMHSRFDEFGLALPSTWDKVWDRDYETWYYWDTVRDMVSWLPPGDPEAVITYPAQKKSASVSQTEQKLTTNNKKEKPKEKHRQVRWQNAEEEADPMDPSSYSDAPTGDWKAGLKKPNDAKTGVDSTASGPLFQQRPYPSPGEVLKRNRQATTTVGPQKPS